MLEEITPTLYTDIILHTCCAPCSTVAIEKLLHLKYKPTLFFSNDNIYPHTEFIKRESVMKNYAAKLGLRFYSKPYDHESWLKAIAGNENEIEGGKRCELCFLYNLKSSNKFSIGSQIEKFTTSLSVSRFKNSAKIFEAGKFSEQFLAIDFKKQNGFQKSVELAKLNNLYRQQYCGCEFSARKMAL